MLTALASILRPAAPPLLELIGAVGAAGSLVFVLVVPFAEMHGRDRNARSVAALAQVWAFATATEAFRADTGRYPTAREGLSALINNTGIRG